MVEKRKALQLSPETQNRRNREAARLALETYRAKKQKIANKRASNERRRIMQNINTRGTMVGAMRERRVEAMYQRMVGQVMRRAAYTPTDFKQLGKIVRARANSRWTDVERLIQEWQAMVKRRVCRMRKKNMQNIATGLNMNTSDAKKKRSQICQEIKNKI